MKDKICIWLAWLLPVRLVYWCGVRMNAHATGTAFSNRTPDEVSIMDAARCWRPERADGGTW